MDDEWLYWLSQWEQGARLVLGTTAAASVLGVFLARAIAG